MEQKSLEKTQDEKMKERPSEHDAQYRPEQGEKWNRPALAPTGRFSVFRPSKLIHLSFLLFARLATSTFLRSFISFSNHVVASLSLSCSLLGSSPRARRRQDLQRPSRSFRFSGAFQAELSFLLLTPLPHPRL